MSPPPLGMVKTFENARDVRNMITSVTQVSGFYDISAADQVYITELIEKLKQIHDQIILRKKKKMLSKKSRGVKLQRRRVTIVFKVLVALRCIRMQIN